MRATVAPLVRVASRALHYPAATGLRAWAIFLPIVLVDGFVLEYLLAGSPHIVRAGVLMALSALAYVVSGVWYLLGFHILRHHVGVGGPVPVSLLVFGVTGATWSVLLQAMNGSMNEWGSGVTTDLPVGLLALGIGGSHAVIGTLIAIVIYAHDQSAEATAHNVAVHNQLRAAEATMLTIRSRARLTYRSWIDQVMQPAVHRLIHTIQTESPLAAQEIDSIREHIVRSTSQRLHPRMVELGPTAALTSVVRAHHVSLSHFTVDITGDLDTRITSTLTQCLDVLLAQWTAPTVELHLAADSLTVQFMISGDADSVTSAGPELRARVEDIGGVVIGDEHGTLRINIPRSTSASVTEVTAVPAGVIPVTWLAACALVLPTAAVIALLGGSGLAVVVSSAASVSVALFMVVLRLGGSKARELTSTPRATSVSIIAAGVATSAVVTGAWIAAEPESGLWVARLAFLSTNAVFISLVIAVLVLSHDFLVLWESRAVDTAAITARTRRDSHAAILSVDQLRGTIASILHSHVQARLVVAAARVESGDSAGGVEAVRSIITTDIPLLMAELESGISTPPTLAELVAEFEGVTIRVLSESPSRECESPAVVEITHEALVNAVRHGAATSIDVVISERVSGWDVRITDNGLGVGATPSRGLGLTVIDAATGGNWELRPGRHGGAELTARVPV
ncbi:MAG: hypothetical protein K9G69_08410 [Candidatus Nanopelagicales bacterium]|nr:hypothetical protein [Candidatus Nanopelagicales bacterium]